MKLSDLKHTKIVNQAESVADMYVFGLIGTPLNKDDHETYVNGHYFARELDWVGKEYSVINVHINTPGGDVYHGLSIFNAMLYSPAKINVIVAGIAASMGGILLAAGDHVAMNDFAKIMLHSPMFLDKDGEVIEDLSKSAVVHLASMKDTLVKMLQKRGLDEAAILALLKENTWLNAEEAKELGLVDEILTTGKIETLAALEPKKLVAQVIQDTLKFDSNSMKKVLAFLKLADDASDDQTLTAIQSLVAKATSEPKAKQEPPELDSGVQKLVDLVIAQGKVTGHVNDKNEPSARKLAALDMGLFVDLFQGTPDQKAAPGARLSQAVNTVSNQAAPVSQAAPEKDWDWYERNQPVALQKMRVANPELYNSLLKADQEKNAE